MANELEHDFSGACEPGKSHYSHQTFSLGIFQWVAKSGGKGLKKSKVRVRVSGPVHEAEAMREIARNICKELDTGTYNGPKTVQVK
jgi:DNA primase